MIAMFQFPNLPTHPNDRKMKARERWNGASLMGSTMARSKTKVNSCPRIVHVRPLDGQTSSQYQDLRRIATLSPIYLCMYTSLSLYLSICSFNVIYINVSVYSIYIYIIKLYILYILVCFTSVGNLEAR